MVQGINKNENKKINLECIYSIIFIECLKNIAVNLMRSWPYTAIIAPETHSSSQDAILICTHYRGGWRRGELSFVFVCIIEKLSPEETQQFMREKLYVTSTPVH